VSDMNHDERDPDSTDSTEGGGRLDVEAAFADIVAHWDDASRTPVGTWPAQEDVDPVQPDEAAPEPPPEAAPMSFSAYDGPHVPLAPEGWSQREELPAAEPEGYVPPEPPPLPRGDTLGWLAWTAVLGGPVFLLMASLWWTDIGRFWIMIAVLAFIAGFAAIVARLPNHRSDDDTDDGAVV
jgi:hypothetical protein